MASLLDLGPLTEEVEVRGVQFTVRGLTSANLFRLASEFPSLPQALQQMSSGGFAAALALFPDLFAKIITTAIGMADNKEAEEKARDNLGVADQLAILMAVQRLSFPQGFGPFVKQLERLMGVDKAAILSTGSSGQGNSSQAPSSAVLQTDSPGMMRGISPRAS